MTDSKPQKETTTGKLTYNRSLEKYVWISIAALVVFPALYYSSTHGLHEDLIIGFYNQILLGALTILTPVLFNLIFGKLPFEYLRSKREAPQEIKMEDPNDISVVQESTAEEKTEKYVFQCINESKSISERIFSRSGVYLLIGCLIAFIGVAVFYSPLFQKTTSTDISQRLLDYLPRFGALFFIEFVAFFFLKQYRIMLEEYRYYEAVKRKRQDNYNLVELIESHSQKPELVKILTENISQTSVSKLANGETTEILETQKIVNQDLDIFSKFTELIKEIKTK